MVNKRLQFALQGRSSRWYNLRKRYLKIHDHCAACCSNTSLEVHHIVPFHIDKAKELDPSNLITLCRHCHLVLGHLRDYDIYNRQLIETIEYFIKLRLSATK